MEKKSFIIEVIDLVCDQCTNDLYDKRFKPLANDDVILINKIDYTKFNGMQMLTYFDNISHQEFVCDCYVVFVNNYKDLNLAVLISKLQQIKDNRIRVFVLYCGEDQCYEDNIGDWFQLQAGLYSTNYLLLLDQCQVNVVVNRIKKLINIANVIVKPVPISKIPEKDLNPVIKSIRKNIKKAKVLVVFPEYDDEANNKELKFIIDSVSRLYQDNNEFYGVTYDEFASNANEYNKKMDRYAIIAPNLSELFDFYVKYKKFNNSNEPLHKVDYIKYRIFINFIDNSLIAYQMQLRLTKEDYKEAEKDINTFYGWIGKLERNNVIYNI